MDEKLTLLPFLQDIIQQKSLTRDYLSSHSLDELAIACLLQLQAVYNKDPMDFWSMIRFPVIPKSEPILACSSQLRACSSFLLPLAPPELNVEEHWIGYEQFLRNENVHLDNQIINAQFAKETYAYFDAKNTFATEDDCVHHRVCSEASGCPTFFSCQAHLHDVPPPITNFKSPFVVPMTAYKAKPTRWLWPDRIPFGSLTLLEGGSGVGKTHIVLDLATRISKGQPFPDLQPSRPGNVLIAAPASQLESVIVPRLEQSEADMRHIAHFNLSAPSSPSSAELKPPPLHLHLQTLQELKQAIEDVRPQLLIVDPFIALFKQHPPLPEHELTVFLEHLKEVVSTYNIACVLIRESRVKGLPAHLTRMEKSPLIWRAAASVLLAAHHPSAPGSVFLASSKHELSPTATTLRFSFQVGPSFSDPSALCSAVVWQGESPFTSADLLSASHTSSHALGAMRQKVLSVLRDAHPQQLSPDQILEAIYGSTPENGDERNRKINSLSHTLRRMEKDKQILSVVRGQYQATCGASLEPSPLSKNDLPPEWEQYITTYVPRGVEWPERVEFFQQLNSYDQKNFMNLVLAEWSSPAYYQRKLAEFGLFDDPIVTESFCSNGRCRSIENKSVEGTCLRLNFCFWVYAPNRRIYKKLAKKYPERFVSPEICESDVSQLKGGESDVPLLEGPDTQD